MAEVAPLRVELVPAELALLLGEALVVPAPEGLTPVAEALRAVRALRGKVAEERARAAAAVSFADRLSVPKASSVAAPRNVVAGARILRKARTARLTVRPPIAEEPAAPQIRFVFKSMSALVRP